jgi:hypothetical protein
VGHHLGLGHHLGPVCISPPVFIPSILMSPHLQQVEKLQWSTIWGPDTTMDLCVYHF